MLTYCGSWNTSRTSSEYFMVYLGNIYVLFKLQTACYIPLKYFTIFIDRHKRSCNHFTDTPHSYIRGLREKPSCRVNQYPFEHLITIKDLLGVVCRRAVHLGGCAKEEDAGTPTWLPLTYCLKRELVKFASLFQRREKRHVSDNKLFLITHINP